MSRALAGPTVCASMLTPSSGYASPSRAAGTPKRVPRAAIRMSHASATCTPPPMHTPAIIAITGLRHSISAAIALFGASRYARACAASARIAGNSEISAPAINACGVPPRMTITRIASSLASSATPSAIRCQVLRLSALRTCGRLSTSHPIGASCVTINGSTEVSSFTDFVPLAKTYDDNRAGFQWRF